jgi:hypothetical protein
VPSCEVGRLARVEQDGTVVASVQHLVERQLGRRLRLVEQRSYLAIA